MNLTSPTRSLLIAGSLCLATLFSTAAHAQSMVSVKGSTLNMREGPGTHTAVLWELKQGYPLRITERKGSWLRVRDFEGDTGWVARSLTGFVGKSEFSATVVVSDLETGKELARQVVDRNSWPLPIGASTNVVQTVDYFMHQAARRVAEELAKAKRAPPEAR